MVARQLALNQICFKLTLRLRPFLSPIPPHSQAPWTSRKSLIAVFKAHIPTQYRRETTKRDVEESTDASTPQGDDLAPTEPAYVSSLLYSTSR